MKTAFIIGITGQDGSYLADLLLSKGYEVHGSVRRTSAIERSRLAHLFHDPSIYNRTLFLHYSELSDITSLRRLLNHVNPDEVYHLAGQSHVGLSFEIPEVTCELTAMGTLRLLEILRDMPRVPRLFHATSAEIFGRPFEVPQTEETPFSPVNPYGCAKAFSTQIVRAYRETFGYFFVNGILYNHESPRRGENFVTRKICKSAASIKVGAADKLRLGNIDARRDWGHARDYVRGMWLSLQHKQPEDYIFSTGKLHSVRDVIELAFEFLDLNWRSFIEEDPKMLRSVEPSGLLGDSSKAKALLGWEPEISFEALIREMTLSDLQLLKSNL